MDSSPSMLAIATRKLPGQRLLLLVSLGISVAILSAVCFLLYVGLGIIYGSYVGLQGREADMSFVSSKMSRALVASFSLQVPLAVLVWSSHALLTSREVPITARIWRTLITIVIADLCALGASFVLGQLGFPPMTDLVRWLDTVLATGLR